MDPTQIVNRLIYHNYAICSREEKDAFIINFLNKQTSSRGLIFCLTKAGAIRMGRVLTVAGFVVTVIHGDLSQRDRDKVMRGFRKERYQFLIATDVAARGIDIKGLSFIFSINFQMRCNTIPTVADVLGVQVSEGFQLN